MRTEITHNHDHDDHWTEFVERIHDNPLEWTDVRWCEHCRVSFNGVSSSIVEDDEDNVDDYDSLPVSWDDDDNEPF